MSSIQLHPIQSSADFYVSRLGDAVIEEAISRLVAREALAALDRAETGRGIGGSEGRGIPDNLDPSLDDQLGSALRLAVSNENLETVSFSPPR